MIYFLDNNPELAGIYLSDKHLSCQLGSACTVICTVLENYTDSSMPQNVINKSNAVVSWASISKSNFEWLVEYAQSVQRHFYTIYGKYHNTTIDLSSIIVPELPKGGLMEFPQLLPDRYKMEGNSVEAYRNYYVMEKAKISNYRQKAPDWFLNKLDETQRTLYMDYFEHIGTNLRIYRDSDTGIVIQKKLEDSWVSLGNLTLEEQILIERILDNGFREG